MVVIFRENKYIKLTMEIQVTCSRIFFIHVHVNIYACFCFLDCQCTTNTVGKRLKSPEYTDPGISELF